MKIWGIAMVRNEQDVVEAFVRHNLTILDGLFVIDHLSSDRTGAILRSLCDERLPLVVVRNESSGLLQAEIMSTAAREVIARAGADFVFPLEADEFLHAPSRGVLEMALTTIPPGHVGRVARLTYLPRTGDAPALESLRDARRLAAEPPRQAPRRAKVVLTREFAGVADAYLTTGNRQVSVGRDFATAWDVRHVDLPVTAVRLCHLPVRSRPQYLAKIAVRILARAATGRATQPTTRYLHELDMLRDKVPVDDEAMLRNYITGDSGVGEAPWPPATAVDPFLAPIELRHAPPPADALPAVLAAVEQMARRLSDAKAAPPGRPSGASG